VTDTFMLVAGLLADETPRDTGPDFGKASPIGLVVVVLLLIATFLLVWSMNKQLKKLPESFDPERPEPDQAADEGTVGNTGGASDGMGKTADPSDGGPRSEPGG
jgi:hypothetical protein